MTQARVVWEVIHNLVEPGQKPEDLAPRDRRTKYLGAFTSQEKAVATIEHAVLQEGFRDYPAGFHVEVFSLDQDLWEHPPRVLRWGPNGLED